ncbi:MAG TPA: PQQ-binding-like beta-propeller repeat protein, partial [Gemmatimonadaceae bacterium]|nr:PQQ-binding-like beta-propeller repeat protein [Gemmatimonadaceae bacterium]
MVTNARSAVAWARRVFVGAGAIAFASAAGCTENRAQERTDSGAVARTSTNAAANTPGDVAGSQITIPGRDPEDGQWLRPAKDYASTRYSELAEITTANAASLKLAWTFSTGVLRGHEAAPLVVDNTMYIVTPFPNTLYALDLARPGGPVKWRYDPQPLSAAQGVACCDVVNRGAAYADGRIFYNTLDNQTVAVDAETGREMWRTRLGDINKGETMTMAPLVVKGKVIVGNSGGELGIHGWLTALDASTGAIAWRAYHTGPDSLVLIGPRFKPFYKADQGTDLGVTTWPPDKWRQGGAGAWGWISYDAELDLIYYGTANPGPWNPELRPGDNKWSTTLFARDPDTGEAVWAYQWNPHDLHDYDSVNESLLLDMPWNGQMRRVMIRPERNGFMYVIDRATGQALAADTFAVVNSVLSVNLETGRPHYNPEKHPTMGEVVRFICPASPGGKDWQPSAFSPRTGYIYVPHQNLCMD